MSTLSQALTNPLVIVILAIGAFGACQWLWKQAKAWKAASDEQKQVANAAIENLACAINHAVGKLVDSIDRYDGRMVAVEKLLTDAASTSDKLLAGTLKACEAIATETAQHRASVEAFSKNLFGQEPNKSLEMPTEYEKDKVYREMEYRAAGKPDNEARDLAEQDLAHTDAIYPSA